VGPPVSDAGANERGDAAQHVLVFAPMRLPRRRAMRGAERSILHVDFGHGVERRAAQADADEETEGRDHAMLRVADVPEGDGVGTESDGHLVFEVLTPM
jgi:hypothetical protein